MQKDAELQTLGKPQKVKSKVYSFQKKTSSVTYMDSQIKFQQYFSMFVYTVKGLGNVSICLLLLSHIWPTVARRVADARA